MGDVIFKSTDKNEKTLWCLVLFIKNKNKKITLVLLKIRDHSCVLSLRPV